MWAGSRCSVRVVGRGSSTVCSDGVGRSVAMVMIIAGLCNDVEGVGLSNVCTHYTHHLSHTRTLNNVKRVTVIF